MELTLRDRHIITIKKRLVNKVRQSIKNIDNVSELFIYYRFCNETLIFMFVTLSDAFDNKTINLIYDYEGKKFTEKNCYDFKNFSDFLSKYPNVNYIIDTIKFKFDEINITDIW